MTIQTLKCALGAMLACLLLIACQSNAAPPSALRSTPSSVAPAATSPATKPAEMTLHPALFLVGDSIMKTGTPPGDRGPWGMGFEIAPYFDPAKIHVYIEGNGGRSSRSYIEEGLWKNVLQRMKKGDYVLLMFGHNDAANSANFPDRTTVKGSGDETQEISAPDGTKETIHTYGWYLQQYIKDARAKGVTPILCSPVPRNTWIQGKIKRGFDGYAGWAKEAAQASNTLFIDLNTLAADKYDALGQQTGATYFNDYQHTRKAGATLNAQAAIEGIRALKDPTLLAALLPAPTIPVAPTTPTAPPTTHPNLPPRPPTGE